MNPFRALSTTERTALSRTDRTTLSRTDRTTLSRTDRTTLSRTDRTTLHRLRERGATDRSALHAVLDVGLICHLGVIIEGSPVVLPTGYGRIGETLYLHGSTGNRSFQVAQDQDICVTVTTPNS